MNKYFRNAIWLLSILLLQSFLLQAQSLAFSKTYGGSANDEGRDIVALHNGDFVITGVTGSKGDTSGDIYLLKIDSVGDTLWQRSYGGSKQDEGNSITSASDGHFFIAGQTNSYGLGGSDAYFLLVDSVGDTLWTKTYGGTGNDAAYSSVIIPDGSFLAVGLINNGANMDDGFLLKISPAGKILWTKLFGGTGEDYFTQIKATPDGNFLLTGTTSVSDSDADIWLVKVDTAGNLVDNLNVSYTDAGNQIVYGLGIAPDNGALLAGTSVDSANTMASIILVRVTKDGDTILWDNTIINSVGCEVNGVVYSAVDSSWVICGAAYNAQNNSNDAFLMKTDDSGNLKWLNYFGGAGADNAKGLSLCTNGDIIFAGYTESSGADMKDVYVVRVHSNGEFVTGIPKVEANNSFSVQPNPFSDNTLIKYSSNLINPKITVFDLFGRIAKTINGETSGSMQLNREELPSGIYFIQLTSDSTLVQTQKVIIN